MGAPCHRGRSEGEASEQAPGWIAAGRDLEQALEVFGCGVDQARRRRPLTVRLYRVEGLCDRREPGHVLRARVERDIDVGAFAARRVPRRSLWK